jgi:hypothetical protein
VPIKTAAVKGTVRTDDPLLAAAVCAAVRALVAPVLVVVPVVLVFWPVTVPVALMEPEEVAELLLELVAMLPPKSG